jgi:RNA polymerase sigma-70 factor (ECF subfamily)
MAKLTVVDGRKADATRFATLIEPHYDGLYRAAYRLTRSKHDAEDLVQEVCARAYVHLSEIAALEQPRSWLHRVMYRLFVDLSRRYERTHVGSIEEFAALVCDRPGPAEEAERTFDR